MKNWILGALLVLACGGAAAAGDRWIALTKAKDGTTTYLDPQSMRLLPNGALVWRKIVPTTPEPWKGRFAKVIVMRDRYDCENETIATTTMTLFANLDQSDVLETVKDDSPSSNPVLPGSINETLLREVCGSIEDAKAGLNGGS